MAQYEVARVLFEYDSPVPVSEIQKKIDVTDGTIRHNLNQLAKKGYVVQEGSSYQLADDIEESDLEDVKGVNIKDLM